MKQAGLALLMFSVALTAAGQKPRQHPFYPPCHKIHYGGKTLWTGGVVNGAVFFYSKRQCKKGLTHPAH